MKGAPRSEQFDDIYFSKDDGLAETRHVFLEGNGLPDAWQGKGSFSIFETGFGTGLNFFAVWDLFEKTAGKGQTLDFVSVEKFPLSSDKIRESLEPWAGLFKDKIDTLCKLYPIRVRGVHRVKISQKITLTLIFDDVNEVIPTLNSQFDCWFLDGFTPTKNPDMWSEILFKNMNRLSKPNASFATFTAAGSVRRGLDNAGFHVEKHKGFGHKRDMMVGHYKGERNNTQQTMTPNARIAIIGGGLAGTSCAYVLKQYGYEPIIYEATDRLASGASGNECGFYNPRFCTLWDFSAQFFAPAYAQFLSLANQAGDMIDYNPCGALHLVNTADKEKRFSSMLENWNWHSDHAQFVDTDKASEIAGINIESGALYLPDAGSVSVKKLCDYYARDIEVHFNSEIKNYSDLKEDVVILCNAHSILKFSDIYMLPIKKVRGQTTKISTTKNSQGLKCNIHFGKYISAMRDGVHHIGATFQPWDQKIDIVEQDDFDNIDSIKENIESLSAEKFEVVDSWSEFRTASKDHFPIVGQLPQERNVYACLAFGSHGIVGSIQSAHILADLLRGNEHCLQFEMKKNINYQRFSERKR